METFDLYTTLKDAAYRCRREAEVSLGADRMRLYRLAYIIEAEASMLY